MKCLITISDMGQNYDAQIARLNAMGIDVDWKKDSIRNTRDESLLASESKGYDIVIAGNERWGEQALTECSDSLKILVRYGIGFDSVAIPTATKLGIPVAILPGCNADSVAERAVALMLSTLHVIPDQQRLMQQGTKRLQPYLTHNLMGKTVGLLGFGNIARAVARFLQPFNCRILAYDVKWDDECAKQLNVEFAEREEILRNADIVSVHLPLIDSTRGTINRETLALMKPGAILINTARGGLVVSDDLAEALREGRIMAAGLDVYENEGSTEEFAGYQFMDLNNVSLTAHTASNAYETFAHMMDLAVDTVENWLKKEPMKGLLNPEYTQYLK